jgi:hypothetical protein
MGYDPCLVKPCLVKKIFRNLLDVSGTVVIDDDRVTVTLGKRAHNPFLVASGLATTSTLMSWLGNKELVLRIS